MEDREKNKQIAKSILIYGIGTFGTKLLSFLIVPLYTYYISTSDMGTYDLLQTTVSLLTPIITFQISDAAYRWMIRNDRTEDCIETTFKVFFLNSVIASLIIVLVNYFFPIPYCYHFIGLLITSRLLQTTLKLLRGIRNQRLFAFSSILYSFLYLSLNVLFIAVLKYGVAYLFISQVIANLLTVALIFIVESRVRFPVFRMFDTALAKEMLSYSIPLVPNLLNWWIMSASDRYVIGIFLGTAFNGIYAISYKFPTLLQQILNLFNTSWQDYSIAEEGRDGQYYSSVFRRLYVFSFSLLPFIIAASQLFIRFTMNSTYHDAAKYVSYLFFGTVFQVFSSFFGVGYLKYKDTKRASVTSIYGAVINIAVNVLLIKYIGLYAASFSTFCGFFVMWLVRYIQTREVLGIDVDWKVFGIHFGVAGVAVAAAPFLPVKADIILVLAGMIWFLYFNRNMINAVLRQIRKRIRSTA